MSRLIMFMDESTELDEAYENLALKVVESMDTTIKRGVQLLDIPEDPRPYVSIQDLEIVDWLMRDWRKLEGI